MYYSLKVSLPEVILIRIYVSTQKKIDEFYSLILSTKYLG